ncbi:Digeranylgeranylglyceryl phosphate synthase [Candidatus Nitrosomarinus catalina]|uniref:Digeranylgeranylglyceryl phosphate synthase n=1 Tax=Candidatus Nitrosomarinus catalinensis TaxID=1898749 RepID=A0A2Z2HHW1_9ARCH|nr:UbiA family prenyltransferase [Candidatus Nitrosomarinus catalina]ARS63798.1 Digeranylgeranylglyceryl phosphate synthase [Candidatus Nitrosomarinus catalina]
MFKEYLQLIRLPGIFTAFSNVLVGYFFSFTFNSEIFLLPYLLTTSGMLFCSGMIFNDYFDYDLDKKERSLRPLASGKISKKNALLIGFIFLIMANISASFLGFDSLIISLILTCAILFYNFKLKSISFLGIINLSIIRMLNILLGFSIIGISFQYIQYLIPLGIFVFGISILAKNEVKSNQIIYKKLNKIMIITTIACVSIFVVNNFQFESLLFLGLFSSLSLYSLFFKKIQNQITFQLLLIILLDSIIISFFVPLQFPIFVSLLILPAYAISKKLYLT